MKCIKCGYTTFDIYDFCPKCNSDLTIPAKTLNLLKYNLTESNNYLIEDNKEILEEFHENGNSIQNRNGEEEPEAIKENENLKGDDFIENSDKDDVLTLEDVEADEVAAALDNFEKDKEDDAISIEDVSPDEVAVALENFEKETDDSSEKQTNVEESDNTIENFEKLDDDISLEDIGLEDLLETNREE